MSSSLTKFQGRNNYQTLGQGDQQNGSNAANMMFAMQNEELANQI